MLADPERAATIAAARSSFDASHRVEDFRRYVDELRGQGYVVGLRERWRTLAVQPLQLAALRSLAGHVRAAGGTPVWVFLPENPFLRLDPEVGHDVDRRSDDAAGAVTRLAEEIGVPVLDLRHTVGPEGFLDLNHLFMTRSGFAPTLAEAIERRGLLTDKRNTRSPAS